jgi:GNAT superfamily N-acetyltransferase
MRELSEVQIRPLAMADVEAAQAMSYATMRQAGTHYGWEMPEPDDESRNRGQARGRHGIEYDPDGCFVAELAGEIVGVALSERRGPLWFLALLAVDSQVQARGIGRLLLDATLRTLDDAGLICASDDPKALRRYRMAGFDLLPCFEAKAALDRSLLPAVTAVREGSHDTDRDLVEAVVTDLRGAAYGPDLDYARTVGHRLFIAESPSGRGFVLTSKSGAAALGATHPAVAADLLWTALAEARDDKVEVSWVTAAQQWAVDVSLAARLPLRPSGSLAVRHPLGPMSPYLPSGGYG